jgi:hypothetical protein
MHTQNLYVDHLCPDQPLRRQGPRQAPQDANAPMLQGIDIAGLIAAAVITLGPLATHAVGFGP